MDSLTLATELAKFGTPTLAEASPDVEVIAGGIVPLYRPIQLWGTAYPIHLGPRDNLAAHFAVAEAPRGSVLAVASGQETRVGFWGEVLTEGALSRGIRGLVTDGAVRDVRAIRELSFPAFSTGVAIPGSFKNFAGPMPEPIALGGVIIRPGDLLIGDDDGVVVVRPESVSQVLEKAQIRANKEAAFIKRLRGGELTLDLYDLRSKRGRENG